MRKLLIGALMAGSLLAPIAANAQREPRNHQMQRDGGPRGGGQDQQARQRPAQVELVQRGDRRGGGEWRGRRGGGDGQGWRGSHGDSGGAAGGRRGGSGDVPATGPVPPSSSVGGWQGERTPETRRDADRYDRRARQNAIRYGTPEQRRDAYRDQRQDRRGWGERDDRRDWRQGRGDRRGSWDRGWRNDRRYSWQDWRLRNRNLFRMPAYYSPYGYGYGYRRYSVGLILDQLLFGQRYWISDPFYYRLPPASYGTQWIRYYNDVILVDVYTGEVLDVIHDFFW